MKVEQIKDNGEEVRLRVSASAAEMSKAFTDGFGCVCRSVSDGSA